MPADYRIDRAARVVYSRAWGVLTDQDLVDNRVALFTDPAFAPEFNQLYDLSAVTEIRVTSPALLQLSLSSRFAPSSRRAVVVSSDVAFGMARMYAILTGHEETVQVFRDRASAVGWLEAARG
ncbi:MAG TPA: hypothetical protein VMF70_12870 [Gemmatimonadales bacterium]|nr:hypothetical protein [Gemmatimonadales bacterium]